MTKKAAPSKAKKLTVKKSAVKDLTPDASKTTGVKGGGPRWTVGKCVTGLISCPP